MFDTATRYAPRSPQNAGFAIPFDWVLGTGAGTGTGSSAALQNLPFHDYSNPCASINPVHGIEALATYALGLEDTLQTAVLLSLFTDKRAGADDALPRGQTDRRGWCGEEFVAKRSQTQNTQNEWGSHLWLLYVGKVNLSVLERARFAAQESLAWFVRDGIASRVNAVAQWAGPNNDRLAIRPQIYQANNTKPIYDVLWGTSLMRGDSTLQVSGGLAT